MSPKPRRVRTRDLKRMSSEGHKIVMLTAYDTLFAKLVDESGVDIVLVGDSVNSVLCGEDTTVSATLDPMIYHGG